MAKKIFVVLDTHGNPIAQRTTDREYNAASRGGGSLSSKGVSPSHPLRVVQVTKALEWTGTAVMAAGPRTFKSKAGVIAPYFMRYTITWEGKSPTEYEAASWDSTAEEFTQKHNCAERTYTVLEWVPVEGTLRNWPQA